MTSTPLTVLDLVPIPSGSTAAQALRNSIDLAQQAERLGYTRYWFAEHHLNPGVAGTSPAVVLALVRRRHVDHPARLRGGPDGAPHRPVHRRGVRPARRRSTPAASTSASAAPAAGRAKPKAPALAGGGTRAATVTDGRTAERAADPAPVLHPAAARLAPVRPAEDAAAAAARRAAELRRADRRRAGPDRRHLPLRRRCGGPRRPGRGRRAADLDPGQQRRESAEVAGANGLRFAANYHVSPATVLEAADGYRAAFQPSADLRPALRQRLGRRRRRRDRGAGPRAGHRLRPVGAQHPHRRGRHPVPHPRARPAATRGPRPTAPWSPTASTPSSSARRGQVADQLERLRDATGADELIITTITHDHADRVRSYELLAEEWARR